MVIIIDFGTFFIIGQPIIAVTSMGSSIEVVGWTIRCQLYHACLSGTHVVTLIEMIRVAYYLRPPAPGVRCARLRLSRLLSGAPLDFMTTRMNETCQAGHSDRQDSSAEIDSALDAADLRLGCLRFLTGIRLIWINFEPIH